MSFVYGITDSLADEVVADGMTFETVFFQDLTPPFDVAIFFDRPVYLEVVAPAGQLQATVAHLFG